MHYWEGKSRWSSEVLCSAGSWDGLPNHDWCLLWKQHHQHRPTSPHVSDNCSTLSEEVVEKFIKLILKNMFFCATSQRFQWMEISFKKSFKLLVSPPLATAATFYLRDDDSATDSGAEGYLWKIIGKLLENKWAFACAFSRPTSFVPRCWQQCGFKLFAELMGCFLIKWVRPVCNKVHLKSITWKVVCYRQCMAGSGSWFKITRLPVLC